MLLIERTVKGFIEETASDSPAPGGGSVSALAGALGAALGCMVFSLTENKKAYADLDETVRKELSDAASALADLKNELTVSIDADTEAFNGFMIALRMPKASEEEKAARKRAMQKAAVDSLEVPLKTAELAVEVLRNLPVIARYGNKNAVSDAGVAGWMARGAVEGAILNVRINIPGIDDETVVNKAEEAIKELAAEAEKLFEQIRELVDDRLD